MNHHLTKREREVVAMRARGKSTHWIAIDLGISTPRVHQLLNNAKRRLAHAKQFSREKEFITLYQRERSLRNIALIANAFYHLSTIMPKKPYPTPWPKQ